MPERASQPSVSLPKCIDEEIHKMFSSSPRAALTFPVFGAKLSFTEANARLHSHDYVVCISDRVDDSLEYPFEGRRETLKQALESITRGDSVLVVGEPGIGKKSISLGFARMLAAFRQSNPYDPVFSRTVYTLSLGLSFWNGSHEEDIVQIQENIRDVFRLVEQAGPEKIIFCIDDVDVLNFVDRLVKESAPPDITVTGDLVRDIRDPTISTENMLRFMLFSKKVICLCTCIKTAYERLRQSDTYYDEKFTKSFRVLRMAEPDLRLTSKIVHAHRPRLEKRHGCTFTNDAIEAAISYAIKYITHRALPEKVLDLLQEACKLATAKENGEARGREIVPGFASPLANRTTLHKQYVDELIRKWCGMTDQQLSECLESIANEMS